MADDLELDLDLLDENLNKTNKVEERIKDLSQKVKLTSQERDDLAKGKAQAEQERDLANKERDFHAAFVDSIAAYPAAKDFKDDIKAKVLAGYTVEDATVAVLAKAGKLTAPPPEKDTAAGGSATNPPPTGAKKLSEMSREEKRQALIDAEKAGDIYVS